MRPPRPLFVYLIEITLSLEGDGRPLALVSLVKQVNQGIKQEQAAREAK